MPCPFFLFENTAFLPLYVDSYTMQASSAIKEGKLPSLLWERTLNLCLDLIASCDPSTGTGAVGPSTLKHSHLNSFGPCQVAFPMKENTSTVDNAISSPLFMEVGDKFKSRNHYFSKSV
jgi:hypothetical protein